MLCRFLLGCLDPALDHEPLQLLVENSYMRSFHHRLCPEQFVCFHTHTQNATTHTAAAITYNSALTVSEQADYS
jgi:hypothetical protein